MRMKLQSLTDEQRQILKRVVEEYYVVLPAALKVHSLFATHVLSHTLHRFGIRTRVLPCRLWCSSLSQKREAVGGFVNYYDREKWNGHVVCLVGDWLVDAALYHLNPLFNYEVPNIIARQIVMPEPGTYARYQLNCDMEFIWYRLPAAAPAVSVTGYEDFIDSYVDTLFNHLRQLMGFVDESADQPVAERYTEEAAADSQSESTLLADDPAELDADTENAATDETITTAETTVIAYAPEPASA